MLKKFKAFMIANIILALVATSVFAFSLMVTIPSMFGSLDAERVAAQAMQYAEVEANIVKLLNYDDLDDTSVLTSSNLHTTRQTLDAIDVSGWEDQITIGDENVMGDGENKYRIAQIDIYKTGDTVPRASLNVPLTSQGTIPGIPTFDYENYIEVPFAPYTVAVDGIAFVHVSVFCRSGAVFINNQKVTIGYQNDSRSDSHVNTSSWLVKKGDIITVHNLPKADWYVRIFPIKK